MVKTLTYTPLEVVAKANADKLTSMDAQALVKAEGKACWTAGSNFCRQFEGLDNALLHSLKVVQAKRAGDTMRDMKAEALVDRLAEVKTGKKNSQTMTNL